MSAPLRIGVLGSTRGTSLQAVIDAINRGALNAKISIVLSNKSDSGILGRAQEHGLPHKHIPLLGRAREAYDEEVTRTLEQHGVQLVLMIGYMRIVSPAFTDRWNDRCLNVHPSLLPDFAGGMDLQVVTHSRPLNTLLIHPLNHPPSTLSTRCTRLCWLPAAPSLAAPSTS